MTADFNVLKAKVKQLRLIQNSEEYIILQESIINDIEDLVLDNLRLNALEDMIPFAVVKGSAGVTMINIKEGFDITKFSSLGETKDNFRFAIDSTQE